MQTPADKETFLRLIDDNRAIIFKICHSYCANKADREDLAQEIIYQLWRSGHGFDAGRRFSTWMYRVALNVAISFYRKNRQNTILSLSDDDKNIADKSPDSEEEENSQRLQRFIYELKELERAMMILYLESRTYREIADIIGITETNVATKISRIKEKLKQRFSTSN
jgi:RNA polymerase sigma factor (sigma-70 family)